MNSSNCSYSYKFLQDLKLNTSSRFGSEIASLSNLYSRRRAQVSTADAANKFELELKRLWSIEAGELERLYSVDRGLTETLIKNGFSASLIPFSASSGLGSDKLAEMLLAHEQGLELVFQYVSSSRPLTKSFIKELHAVLVSKQTHVEAIDPTGARVAIPLIAGDWKKHPNNPTRSDGFIHEYCPPIHVEAEMDKLLEWHEEHLSRNTAPEVEAAWLHHRFTQIHPFQDGNGRVARALASFVLIRANCFPLVFLKAIRDRYIDCLEKADAGDLLPFIELIAETQRAAFIKAFQAESVIFKPQIQQSDEALLALVVERGLEAKAILSKEKVAEQELFEAGRIAESLLDSAVTRLVVVAEKITGLLKEVDSSYGAEVTKGELHDLDYQLDIREISAKQQYYADLHNASTWCRLNIRADQLTEIVIHFHGFGVKFSGVLAASAFVNHRRSERINYALKQDGPYILTNMIFLIPYNEPKERLEERFRTWLNDIVDDGTLKWLQRIRY